MFNKIDIARFSQKALPIAKSFDKNNSGALEEDEYNNFIQLWQNKYNNENPLLMQLHLNALTDEARTIAESCNIDSYKEVLTETELLDFIEKYEQSGLSTPFKTGIDLNAILKGKSDKIMNVEESKNKKGWGVFNFIKSGYQLFKNMIKKEQMNYIGADKFFHSVGNFEGLKAGSEKSVQKLCNTQDKIKRNNFDRCEGDFAEDMYANWLGREMAKLYPNENPNELFAPLAPTGFDLEESKLGWVELVCKNGLCNSIKKLSNAVTRHFNESFIAKKGNNKQNNYIVQKKHIKNSI